MSLDTLGSSRLSALVHAAAAVAGATDLKELLIATVETAMDLTGAPYGALGVVGEHGTLVEFVYRGMDEDTADLVGELPGGRGVLGLITRTGASLRLDELADHPASSGFPEHHPPMHTFLGVPVRAGDSLYGNLYLTEKEGGFTEEDQSVVEALALIAGSAVNTLRLQRRLTRLAVAEDRERIARDIHDAIIQDLFAVGLALQANANRVSDTAIRENLVENARHIDDSIASLRKFIFDLGRPPSDQRNLRDEVEDLVTRLSLDRPADVMLQISGSFAAVRGTVIDDVLQLIREALSNALRHAEATEVTVVVTEGDDRIAVEVVDNGIGFDLTETEPGLGLANLVSRAERAEGELRIDTAPGEGTHITATIPRP